MLSILKDILEDSVDFGWERARAFYTMLGRQVEQRRLLWSDTERILKLRLTHSRVSIPDSSTKPKRLAKIKTCAAFQKGSCDQPADHGQFHHVCDYCLRARSAVFPHSELKCRSKEGSNPKKRVEGGQHQPPLLTAKSRRKDISGTMKRVMLITN